MNRPLRLAFLNISAGMGGSEASLLDLVKGVRRARPDWACHVLLPRDGALSSRLRTAGAAVHLVPLPSALASFGESGSGGIARRGAALVAAGRGAQTYAAGLSATIGSIAPDVVHSNGLKLHLLASHALDRDLPLVWHMHEYIGNRRLSRTLLRRFRDRPVSIVANSHSVAEDVAATLGREVATIYNAVDLDEFQPAGEAFDLDARSGLAPAPPGTVRVGLVATFARWKGHEVFLRSLRELPVGVRGYIVGGPLYDTAGSQYSIDELQALAREIGVADRVGFTGFVDRPAAAMRALDIVVHASTQPEPFGLAIVQAMAAGRAVVVSAGGGARELVNDGIDALTHAPGDVAGLARAIDTLSTDVALRQRLGAEAHRAAAARFSSERFAGAFVEVYERAAAKAVPA